MPEPIKTISSWLTTSGIKIIGILIALLILSQMSRWIIKWWVSEPSVEEDQSSI